MKSGGGKKFAHQNGTQAMNIHLISTFTGLQLFICQIHLLQAKWTFIITLGSHGDSTLKEARNLKNRISVTLLENNTIYKNVQFWNIY